jgi:hypothetical protein
MKKSKTFSLRERALLVKLETTMFGLTKTHKEISAEAAASRNADASRIRGIVQLIDKRGPYRAVKQHRDWATQLHRTQSGAFEDAKGWRIISTKGFPTYRDALEQCQRDFNRAADEFATNWGDIVAEAKSALGGAFDPEMYPSADAVRAKFSMEMRTRTLPEFGHIMMDLSDEFVAKLQAEATAIERAGLDNLRRDTAKKVSEGLTGLIDALNRHGVQAEGMSRKGSFKDTLIDNVAKIAQALPGLNVEDDPAIAKLASDVAALTITSPAQLRGEKTKGDNRTDAQREADAAKLRKELAAAAQDIAADLDGIFGGSAE